MKVTLDRFIVFVSYVSSLLFDGLGYFVALAGSIIVILITTLFSQVVLVINILNLILYKTAPTDVQSAG